LLARRLGLRVGVVTSVGDDVDLCAALPGVMTAIVPARSTTRFHNAYVANRRVQLLIAHASPLSLAAVPDAWRAAPIVHLAPISAEVDTALLAALRPTAGFLGATPQGWLRVWDRQGRIYPRTSVDLPALLAGVDGIVVSEEDLAAELAGVQPLVAPGRIVALTRGAAGVRVLQPGRVDEVAACPASPTDPTGAGDVFAAAWFIRLAAGDEPVTAARYAACAAACAVEGHGLAGVPTAQQIEERLAQWEP
jgi:sugar/nucleoside kinase (ribokinase family)